MAEQSGERRVAAEVGEELISLMVPDVDPELVQLMLSASPAARQVAVLITRATGAGAENPGPDYSRGIRNCLLSSATPASTPPGSARSSGWTRKPCRPARTTRIHRYSDGPCSGRCRPERDTRPVNRKGLPGRNHEPVRDNSMPFPAASRALHQHAAGPCGCPCAPAEALHELAGDGGCCWDRLGASHRSCTCGTPAWRSGKGTGIDAAQPLPAVSSCSPSGACASVRAARWMRPATVLRASVSIPKSARNSALVMPASRTRASSST